MRKAQAYFAPEVTRYWSN